MGARPTQFTPMRRPVACLIWPVIIFLPYVVPDFCILKTKNNESDKGTEDRE